MFDNVLTIFSGLVGLGALISMLVNVGKALGWVPDGSADKVYKILNLVAFIAVAVVYIFVGDFSWSGIDSIFQLLSVVLGYVLQAFSGKVTYTIVKGTPLIGYSHEDQIAKG